jgi:serine phosphatase RsbU (regulator of sigma subunit)
MQTMRQPVSVAVAARPYPGEPVSGDAWQVDWHGPLCRIAVVDGLGHGPCAATAALAATTALAVDPALTPVSAVARCHDALRGTRGAALLVAAIDVPAGRLTIAGVGNVAAHLWQDGRRQHLVTDRGIAGSALPRLRPVEAPIGADWTLLIHTDGIRDRFDMGELIAKTTDAHDLAETVLRHWGRPTDDATVVVAQPLPPEGASRR